MTMVTNQCGFLCDSFLGIKIPAKRLVKNEPECLKTCSRLLKCSRNLPQMFTFCLCYSLGVLLEKFKITSYLSITAWN